MNDQNHFLHNGARIYMDAAGKFMCNRDGVRITAGSLAGIKRKLDKAVADSFQPFDAVSIDSNGEFETSRVVGIKKPRAAWRNANYVTAESNYAPYQVAEDTKANRAAMCAHYELRQKNRKLREDMDKAERALQAKIVFRNASDEAKKKG